MLKTFCFFLCLFLTGCATDTHQTRNQVVEFKAETPAGPINGTMITKEQTEIKQKTSVDTPAVLQVGSTFANVASVLPGPLGIVGGLLGLGVAWLMKRSKEKAEKSLDTANGTLESVTAGVQRFMDNGEAIAVRSLKSLLSQEMDASHKTKVRELKP